MQARAVRGFVTTSVVLSMSVAFTCARDAAADEPLAPPPKPPAREEVRPWRISTGIGFGATVGGLGTPSVVGPPGGYVGFERKLVGPLWLLGRFGGEYSRYTQGPLLTTTLAGVGGSVGLRVALTSPKILEVSVFGLFGGVYDTSRSTSPGIPHAQSGLTVARRVGGQIGLALDREIVPGFGLRVSTTLARATYTASTTTIDDGRGDLDIGRQSQSGVSLELSPALELRWSF